MTVQPAGAVPRSRGLVGRIASAGWLVAVWLLLWDSTSVFHVLSGVLVAAVVLAVFRIPREPSTGRLSPVALAALLGYLAVDLVVSSGRVVWEAVRPGPVRLSSVVEVPLLHSRSDALMALIVNAIGVTPGSLVVEVDIDAGVLHLHKLAADTDAERERLRRHVLRVERLAVQALGSPEERATVRAAEAAAVEAPGTAS